MQLRFFYFAASAGIAALTIYLFVSGRDILIPLAIAFMAWFLLNAVAHGIGRLRIAGFGLPRWATLVVTVAAFIAVIMAIGQLVSGNFEAVVEAAPVYEANLQRLISNIAGLFGQEDAPSLTQLVERLDLRGLVGRLATTITSIAGNAGIIFVYVLFLFLEQGTFDRKLSALFENKEREEWFRDLLSHMSQTIERYIWIKTLMSILTSGLSYIVLASVGVDFAEFWAIIIFLLNYIPTIGSLLGIVFPALLVLVQFDSLGPFFIVTPALAVIQISVGNFIEPMLMGSSLNISPLTTLVSLAVWGSIWGISGMFLCVPMTVIAMIVFAHFPQTRPIAVLLSSNGKVAGETEASQQK